MCSRGCIYFLLTWFFFLLFNTMNSDNCLTFIAFSRLISLVKLSFWMFSHSRDTSTRSVAVKQSLWFFIRTLLRFTSTFSRTYLMIAFHNSVALKGPPVRKKDRNKKYCYQIGAYKNEDTHNSNCLINGRVPNAFLVSNSMIFFMIFHDSCVIVPWLTCNNID